MTVGSNALGSNQEQEDTMRGSAMSRSTVFISFLFVVYGQCSAQWQRTPLPVDAKVNTLAIRDSIIFAGTDGEGIFESTDNGEHWHSINEGLQNKFIHTIFINGTSLFAGTEAGASLSTDNGLSWSTVNSGLSDKGVWSFAAHKSMPDDSTIFAGTWSGVYRSTNSGKSWTATGLSTTTMPVHSLLVRNYDMFAATLGGGVFISQNIGFSWNDISIKYIDKYSHFEAVNAVYALALIDTTIVASVETGFLFYYAGLAESPFAYVQGTPHIFKPILCFARHNEQLFAGNTVGDIFFSNFDGSQWDVVTSSFAGHAVYSLALNDSNVFAGTESGIWRLRYPEISTTVVDVKGVPTGFALEQNYPNPFNSSTKIKFSNPSAGRVTLKVYNMLGSVVQNLIDKTMAPGTYQVDFSPAKLPSGVFFYSLVAHNTRITKKLILMK